MRAAMKVRGLVIGALSVLAACTFDQQMVAVSTPEVIVHAVLDPSAATQQVLVEQSLIGTVNINDKIKYDSLDPITTAGGVPISGATVTITGPDGSFAGAELHYNGKPSTYGQGRYVVQAGLGKVPIRPGAKYTLTVRTPSGVTVTGTTVVPNAAANNATASVDPFDRERDTLKLKWNPVPLARTYGLRVDSPFGAFQLFSDTTHLEIPGTLRNFFASDLQRVFVPGFQQTSTVVAVDTNFYDYYRSRNDPFTGSGLINKLKGGIGLFGSVVTLDTRSVTVTQPVKEPNFEGTYEFVSGPVTQTKLIDVFQLYVESSNGSQASLSGWYKRNRTALARDGVAGTRDGSRIEMDFLVNQDLKTAFVRFIGTQVGDSLVGAYTISPTRVVFKRQH
jgi:hypothetical protein